MDAKHLRIGFLQFQNLTSINTKRPISKAYLRLVGFNCPNNLPVQMFVHRCETPWRELVNYADQPVYRPEPYSSIILREVR